MYEDLKTGVCVFNRQTDPTIFFLIVSILLDHVPDSVGSAPQRSYNLHSVDFKLKHIS